MCVFESKIHGNFYQITERRTWIQTKQNKKSGGENEPRGGYDKESPCESNAYVN